MERPLELRGEKIIYLGNYSSMLIALSLVFFTTACRQVQSDYYRLDWDVEVNEKMTQMQEHELQLEPKLIAHETWWVSPDELLLHNKNHDSLIAGQGKIQWISLKDGWFIDLDERDGSWHALKLARWEEDRRRRSRAWLLECLEKERALGQKPGAKSKRSVFEAFYGNVQLLRSSADSGRRRSAQFSAVPGRLWQLVGKAELSQRVWSQPIAMLGFESVSMQRAAALATIFSLQQPKRILEMALPNNQRTMVIKRSLTSLKYGERSPAGLVRLRGEIYRQLVDREKSLQDFKTLWSYIEHPENRPLDLDLRGLRYRLEECAQARDLSLVREQIRSLLEKGEVEELEEMLQLFYAIDQEAFARWYQAAWELRDTSVFIPMLSVWSLRAPKEALRELRICAEATEFWESLNKEDRDPIQAWLLGVKLWTEIAVNLKPWSPLKANKAGESTMNSGAGDANKLDAGKSPQATH